jgi:type IV pilus assembly protein PilM
VNGKELKDRLEDLFSPQDTDWSLEALFSGFDFGPAPEVREPKEVPPEAPQPPREREQGKSKTKKRRRFLPGFLSRGRLTISLEPDEVRMMVVRGRGLSRWLSQPLPGDVLRGGEVVEPTAFGEALAAIVQEAGAPARQAIVSLSGQRSLVRILTLPSVPPEMQAEAIQREARRELPVPLEELYLSYQILDDQTTANMRVFTVGIPREAVERCVAGLGVAGLRAVAMDLKPLALVRAVNLSNAIVANLEQATDSVVLVRDFVPRITRSIALPGAGKQSMAERGENLAAEIERTLEFYTSTGGAGASGWEPPVCLTGALAEEHEVVSRIASRWPLVDPSPPIPLPSALPISRYMVNVGLAVKRLK